MEIVVTYDINIKNKQGRKRLRMLAQECKNYGQRIQKSVFECSLNNAQIEKFIYNIKQIIDFDKDNVKIYKIQNREESVLSFGLDKYIDFNNSTLIF